MQIWLFILIKKTELRFPVISAFGFLNLTSDFLSNFCITMCLALLPEMLMCSWSLNISCPVPSWSISSFSSFFSSWLEPPAWLERTGGDASTGFTRPTWGSTGMGGRTGVTPVESGQTCSQRHEQYKQILSFIFTLILVFWKVFFFNLHSQWKENYMN